MNNTMKQKKAIKASTWSAILSLLGFLIILSAMAYSALEVSRLGKKKVDLVKEISEKEKELSEKKEELDKLQTTIDYVRFKVDSSKVKSEEINQAKQALDDIKPVQAEIRPRVYIHIQREAQLEKTRHIADALKAKGYLVPRAEILVNKGPNNTQVRYFKKTEEDEAIEIERLLKVKFSINNAERIYISGYETSTAIRPKHYEIWIGKNHLL